MRGRTLLVLAILALAALPVAAQGTPPSVVQAYESLADTILAVRATEAGARAHAGPQEARAATPRPTHQSISSLSLNTLELWCRCLCLELLNLSGV